MAMSLSELVEQLQDLLETYPDAQVALAHQPSWPFEYTISQVAAVSMDENGDTYDEYLQEKEEHDVEDCDECDIPEEFKADKTIVYIAEGGQTRYLPGGVASELGWR